MPATPHQPPSTPPTTSPELEAGEQAPDTTNWRRWYWLVLGALAVEIVFFTYLTRVFSA